MLKNRKVVVLIVLVIVGALIWAFAIGRGTDEDGKAKGKKKDTPTEQVTKSMPLAQVLSVDPQFATFADLMKAADLDVGEGDDRTLLIPSTEAFAREGGLVSRLAADPAGALTTALQRHVLTKRYLISDLAALDGQTVATLAGEDLPVTVTDGVVSVGGIRIAKSDIETAQGIVDVLDGVIGAEPAGEATDTPEG